MPYQNVELWPFFLISRKERQGLMPGKLDIQREECMVSFNIGPRIQKLF